MPRKPKAKEEKPVKPKASPIDKGIKERIENKPKDEAYIPDKIDRVVQSYVKKRVDEMIDYRRGLGIENRWREADEEYVPHELDFGTTRKRFETDQDTGLRSRMVPVGDATQQWRQASSAPTLLAKIQTALSMIVDNMPEADLVALEKRYQATTEIAYALWKRNWSVTDAKEKLKIIMFDLMRYGWGAQRTFPRHIKYQKRILISKDTENPENDKYEDKEIVWFSDIDRQPLDVYRTWIDELSTPYDPYSTNECYYEMDFSYDAAEVEFGHYPNWKYVKLDSQYIRTEQERRANRTQTNREQRTRKDIVTVGFFQSRHKDLYVIYIPKDDIVLFKSPLPNDEGYLDLTHTLWLLRKSSMPYGVSLWEVIRQNKTLYDKMKNMTMDQLVLSIMKFGFFSGTNTALGDGKIDIVPGQARQITTSSGNAKGAVDWMEIPGPGEEAWKGLEALADMMDDDSGISPTMEGDITGKTLGEIKLAENRALKRLKTPLENVAWLIDQDAYLTLSWMSQVYTTPDVQEFSDEDALKAYEQENGKNHIKLFGTPTKDEDGNTSVGAPYEAHYLPELALHLEKSNGVLGQSKDSQFFQIGKDILPAQMKWKGIFKTRPRSIIDNNEDTEKAVTLEMSNMLIPLFGQRPQLVAKAAKQICDVHEEDPKDWLPDDWLMFLDTGKLPPTPGMPGMPPGAPGAAPGAPGQAGPSMQANAGMTPPQGAQSAPTVVPPRQISGPPQGPGSIFKRRI